MTTVSILQARRRLSELVARAWRGKEFGITRPGEDLARRAPLEALNPSGQASALAGPDGFSASIGARRARSSPGWVMPNSLPHQARATSSLRRRLA